MTHGLVVRRATEDDLDSLMDLGAVVQELHVAARPDLFHPVDPAAVRTHYIEVLGDVRFTVFLALSQDRPVGFMIVEVQAEKSSVFRRTPVTLYVHQLAVAPDARRVNVGSRLMDSASDLAEQRGAECLRLDSWSFNTGAHAFFEEAGYSPMNTIFERWLH